MSTSLELPRPVALLTDFGQSDWYVAALKGEILRRAPGAPLVDVTHAIPPGDVRRAAFVLAQAWRSFPAGSVFLVVVDPGVGSARRPLGVRAGGWAFVGPDNGVLSPALRLPGAEARVLDPACVGAGAPSATFHGRDLFAPAAARLAAGTDLAALGEPASDPVLLDDERPFAEGTDLVGHVVHVDRFGNCITDVSEAELRSWLAGRDPRGLRVRAGGAAAEGLAVTYADGAAGAPLALIGSGGRLEIAVAGAHAGARLGLGAGDPVRLEWRES